jgi:Xaa-Pro dipeptidase
MGIVSAADAHERVNRLRASIKAAGYEVVALIPGATIYYLTGVNYHLGKRPQILFIPAEGTAAMICPALEVHHAEANTPFPLRMFSYTDAGGYLGAFEQACQAMGLAGKKVAVEGLKMRVLEGQLIERYAPGSQIVSADSAITEMRIRKQASELTFMRQAIDISQAALQDTLAQITVGMTERQATLILQTALNQHGAQGYAFDPIVLAGANSALPHGIPGDATIKMGDLLLFDFGAAISLYPADITRTFAIGEIDPELKRVYEVVQAANAAGIAAARPGVAAQEVDRAARSVIVAAGYGDYFIHRTGHGLGLDTHEGPNIVEGNAMILEPGMVFTVEPGIYLPGRGGVRIEDNLVVTEDGVDVMTSFPKALRTLAG